MLHRSFIYKINSNGPSMEPWGTPHVISNWFDFCPFSSTYCLRLDKKLLTQFSANPRSHISIVCPVKCNGQ